MKDIQNQYDHRRIDIKKVGVKTITYPIMVLDKARSSQKTIATINMYVNLPHQFKGTHMSRFIEILNRFHGKIDIKGFRLILEEMKTRLEAEAAHMEMMFPFFLNRQGDDDILRVKRYQCAMSCHLAGDEDLLLDITVPIAHPYLSTASTLGEAGLWGNVLLSVRFNKFMWLEDLIDLIESTISFETNNEIDPIVSGKPIESLLEKLEYRFKRLAELSWYSITVENLSQGYSLFATACSSGPSPDLQFYHR